jgi:hypothetical protein
MLNKKKSMHSRGEPKFSSIRNPQTQMPCDGSMTDMAGVSRHLDPCRGGIKKMKSLRDQQRLKPVWLFSAVWPCSGQGEIIVLPQFLSPHTQVLGQLSLIATRPFANAPTALPLLCCCQAAVIVMDVAAEDCRGLALGACPLTCSMCEPTKAARAYLFLMTNALIIWPICLVLLWIGYFIGPLQLRVLTSMLLRCGGCTGLGSIGMP